ncbi:MAG: stage II sporulation protein D [Oscillospiraceae bacterium]|nr:stage II sporulation protein D [Oscillospiraceae bacterium]
MKPILIVSLLLTAAVFLLPLASVGTVSDPEGQGREGLSPEEIQFAPSFIPEPAAPTSPTMSAPAAGDDGDLMVKVLVKGTVQELTMRDYLFGVVAAEMPASFPTEALRAQAVAARTNTENKMLAARGPNGPPERHMGADVCDDYHHCKAYIAPAEAYERWGAEADKYAALVAAAVDGTDSLVVTYEGQPIVAVFFAVSAGRTESAQSVWGTDIPYLREVDSPGEDGAQGYEEQVTLPAADVKAALLAAYPDAQLDGPPSGWFGVPERSEAGGVLSLTAGGVAVPGTKLREMFNLRSTHFTVTPGADTVVFDTLGYGHGVGLSQYGAKLLAESGLGFEEILTWYYTGVTVEEYHPAL